ncbi:MAG: hypothetical protein ACOCYR_08925 [Erythrobacter sp.]
MTEPTPAPSGDLDEATDFALRAVDAVIQHIAICAAENELPDKIALAAVMVSASRLAIAFLGHEAAAREFAATAERIAAHGAAAERLARSEPAGRA